MKKVGGVWLPDSEVHFEDMMLRNAPLMINGKATYQYRKLDESLKHVKNWERCIDIGAHVGLWSMWLVKRFKRLEAFEPVPNHANIFGFNLIGFDNYTLHRVALGDVPGVVSFQIPSETTGNAHVAIEGRHPGTKHIPNPDKVETVAEVPMDTLDGYEFKDVGYIKIDVEGYEKKVLEGAKNTILSNKPIIVVEQKGNESAYGGKKDEGAEYLKSLGVKPLRVMGGDWIFGWD